MLEHVLRDGNIDMNRRLNNIREEIQSHSYSTPKQDDFYLANPKWEEYQVLRDFH